MHPSAAPTPLPWVFPDCCWQHAQHPASPSRWQSCSDSNPGMGGKALTGPPVGREGQHRHSGVPQCLSLLGAMVPTWMMLLLELLESAPTYTVKKGVARYVPDTLLSTSMKLVWFQEPVMFHPPICQQTDLAPQGGVGGIPEVYSLPRCAGLSPDSSAHVWVSAHLVDELHEGLGAQFLYPLLLEAGQVVSLCLPLCLTAGVEGGVFCGRLWVSPSDTGVSPSVSVTPWCPPRRCFMMA